MEHYKIFENFVDSRKGERDGESVWQKKRAYHEYCFRDELSKASSTTRSQKIRSAPNTNQTEETDIQRIVEQITSPGYISTFSYTLRDTGLRRPEIDEYRHLLSSEIKIGRRSWNELDTDPELQAGIFDVLDKGILIVDNIPKIPIEHEYRTKEFYGFDTEDNSFGMPHFHQFSWRDGVAFSFSFRLLFLWASEQFNLKAGNHITWCTNLEYDFGNILKDWDVDAESLDIRWRRGKLAKAILKYDPKKNNFGLKENDEKHSMEIWDTMNHWMMSVEKQGHVISDMIGFDFSKLKKNSFYSFKYAAMDAIISRSYASIQACEYERRGIPFKLTPGAVSMAWYMQGNDKEGERFCKQRVYNTHEESELDWLFPALKGGRTEVFSLKRYEADKKGRGIIGYFDINSAYPHSMLNGTFPKLNPHFWREGHNNIAFLLDEGYEGVVDCEVDTSDVKEFVKVIPYLGLTDEKSKRFIFPLGEFRSKYTFFEIRQAAKYGYKFKFIKAMCYERAKIQPFETYIKAAYGLRLEGAATGNQILRDIGKSLGNNLYGKFGQRSTFASLVDPSTCTTEQLESCARLGDAVILEQDEGYAVQTNVVWGAYITAMTRDLLYTHMINAICAGNEVLYCDTDSIFITGGTWPESHPTNLGALKHEDNLDVFQAILPKCYVYKSAKDHKTTYKVKGVPYDQKEIFFTTGRVEYRKPIKIRENQRRKNYNKIDTAKGLAAGGVSGINAWVTVKKELKGKYTKRIVNKDGSTSPLILRMDG